MAKASPTITPPVVAVPTKIWVANTLKLTGKGETSSSEEEVIEVHKFATQPALVRASIPIKMTMDYQSLGIELGIEMPVYAEQVEKGLEEAYARVYKMLQEKIPEIQKTLLEVTGRSPVSK